MSITFYTPFEDGPELNAHNANGVALLRLLGLPLEPGGEVQAEDLLGRILTAQALLDVATDDEHGRPAFTEDRFTCGGRDPGYLAGRLTELQEIATWAHQHHAEVYWG